MSEKKIDLIAQLLAKAESTTPEEAEALTEHAERLMVKYAIDQAVIDARRAKAGQESEKIVEVRLDFTGAYRGELVHMTHMVSSGLGSLRNMQYTGGTGKVFSAYIIGFESDVEQAKTLVMSLQVQAAVAVRAWWREHKGEYAGLNSYEQEKARRTFVYGFGTGAGSRIRESRQQVVNEATAARGGAGTELVLVNRRAKVNEHMDAKKNLKNARSRNAATGGSASGQGYAAGQKANTGEKKVTQGRGISA